MIFNKNNKGNEEISLITGSYYKNNNFDKVKPEIMLATAEVIKVIGRPVYALAEAAYISNDPEAANTDLIPYVQMPIGIMATMNMYRANDISHEDSGRKVKIDAEHEKIPWEWQLKADDEMQMDKYYKSMDNLIDYLDAGTLDAWTQSDFKKACNKLLINTTQKFDFYYPINQSGRLYILLLPFIREVESVKIKRAFGDDYARYVSGSDLTETDNQVLEYLLPAIPLLAMSLAVRRMPLGLIPSGVVRNYGSRTLNPDASDAPPSAEISQISDWMSDDAEELLELAKATRNGSVTYQILPVNDRGNKFMRV